MLYISIFVLDLYNFNNMKKSILLTVVLTIVIATLIMWAINSEFEMNFQGLSMAFILLIIIAFAAFQILSRIKSASRQEPPEDELSKKIMRRASSMAFYTSIYSWLVFSFLNDRWQLEGHTIIGAGILAMVIIFVLYWIYFKIAGIKDA